MKILDPNYEIPSESSNFMKLQDGDNKFRILTDFIIGWEDWIDNKPVRYRMDAKPSKSHDPKKKIKYFWAFVVWNYAEEKIQILQISQKSIKNSILEMCKSEDWGTAYFYDIRINKKGEGINTEYHVTPVPHKPLPQLVRDAFDAKRCNLEAIFDNQDPFAGGYMEYTPGVFSVAPSKVTHISEAQAKELEIALQYTDAQFQKTVTDYIKGPEIKAPTLQEIPVEKYDKIYAAVKKKATEKVV